MNTQENTVRKKKAVKKSQPKEVLPEEWSPLDAHLDINIHVYLEKYLLPFHSYLSKKNMDKKYMSPELDLAIDKLAKVNGVLSKRNQDRRKARKFGED